MSSPAPTRRHFVIVPARPHVRVLIGALLAIWLASIIGAWVWASRRAAPELAGLRVEQTDLQRRHREQSSLVDTLRQRVATLKRSDEISRQANTELQESLAQRDEEITALRADVAFYERLVGAAGQRRGLSVHSVDFAPDADGTWHYTLTLTQNLNRGKISKGELSLQLEGVQAGKLARLNWADLLQDAKATPQPFAFRYFQQLEGSVMLPAGFAPHRVRVQLRADGNSSEQVFPWETARQSGQSGET